MGAMDKSSGLFVAWKEAGGSFRSYGGQKQAEWISKDNPACVPYSGGEEGSGGESIPDY